MANKQFLIELAVKDDKLNSSLKKALMNSDVQKTLGILGEGITEHLEKDVGKAASILGKVDWASLLGEKDFEHLQQIVAKTISANKDMIKSFIKSGDTKGIQDAIGFVSELNAELKAINPEFTTKGLARSMASFMKMIEPLTGASDKIMDAFDGIANGVDKSMSSAFNRAGKTLDKMRKDVLNAFRTQLDVSGESIIKYQIDDRELNEYINQFRDAKSVTEELNKEIENSQSALRKMSNASTRDASTMLSLVKHEQKITALREKLMTLQPSVNGDVITKDIDATVTQIADKLEKSFNKIIEDKLSSIKVQVDVPTEEKLIADLNEVIAKVNEKGTSSLKLVGAESAIKEAQNKMLKDTQEWHNRMKDALKFSKKEDIELDLGVKLREIGSDVGADLRRSIEEYFDNPANKVAVPVELVMTGENKAIIEGGGGNITINGGVGGGEITAESLAKALTTPIEVKVQEEQSQNKPSGKLISLDYESGFAQEVLAVFDQLFEAIERGGENAKKISDFFTLKDLNLSAIKGKPMDILKAYETFLERGDASILDQVEGLAKGGTKNKATIAFRDLLRDSVFRFGLDHITTAEDVKRRQVRTLVEEDYIPRSKAQESLYKIRNTNAKDYKLPTVEELSTLMTTLPHTWGKLGEDFLPALESLKQLRSTITDPTNATEIQRFKEAADAFALNTNSLYREMSDFMKGYKIGVFNKGHNKHDNYFDYSVNGGVFSGSKLASNLDKVDYFELYDDPSGHFSRGSRQDAMDNASSLDRYQLRRDSRNASYRSKEPVKTSVLAEDVEIPKFEPKEQPNRQLQEINEVKNDAKQRAQAMEDARKTLAEEAKKAEELRQQELATDKKRRTALRSQRTKNANKLKEAEASGLNDEVVTLRTKNEQLDKEISELDARISKNSVEPTKSPTVLQQLKELPKASEIQSMIDEVEAIDAKIDEAQQKSNELDEFVNKNFKAEKDANVEYTKSEKNNQNKNTAQNDRLTALSQVLNEPYRTELDSMSGLTEKDLNAIFKLLNDRKLYQMINGDKGLGMPINSQLEYIAKQRLQAYQSGLNQIDEFILKNKISIGTTKSNVDLTEFMKDDNVRKVLSGTFKGTQEDEAVIKTKIDEFKARMIEEGKSYVVDYIDMWADKNLRELIQKGDVDSRTTTDAKGASILQEFYRILTSGGEGDFSKRSEAYEYLKSERAKYQKDIQKGETSLGKVAVSVWDQSEVTEEKNQAAIERVKEKYKEYVNQWLYTIQENMYNILFGELDDKDVALKLKKNDELHGLITSLDSQYFEAFGETLLTKDQSTLLKESGLTYRDFKKQEESSLTLERTDKQTAVDAIIAERSELLKQRRFDLLNKITDGTAKGKDTASLEKALSEVEDELIKYSDQLPHLVREEFEADLLNAKNATEEEWKQFKDNSIKRRNEFDKSKYSELKGQQKSILEDIKHKTNTGESTGDLEKQLEAINKEIVQYEVNTSRLNDIELAKFPNNASVMAIKTYNTEMEKLVELQQQQALLKAKGKDTDGIDADVRKQRKRLKNRVSSIVEEDRRVAAEYAPANQAAEFIQATDRAKYVLEEQVEEAARKLRTKQMQLEAVSGDGYRNATAYDKRIRSLKAQDVTEYIHSGRYKADRDRGMQQVNSEFSAYLTEQLGEDVAKKIVYEFAQNQDRADIDAMLEGAGNTTRLVEDAFGSLYVQEYMSYTNSDSYEKLVSEKKATREAKIDEEFAGDKAKLDAKIQEIWNQTKADIAVLKNADMANSQILRDAVIAEAEKAGMGDSSEYRRSIVDQVREDLIQQRIESGRQEQKFYNKEYYDKVRTRRAELSSSMYKEINEQADRVVYNAVMSKIQGLIGDNQDLMRGLETKRAELIDTHVGGLVDKYREGLKFEETNMYKGENIREMVIKELEHAINYYEQKHIEASGRLGVLKHERARAQSFGELGYDEILNPEVAQVRAETEARLSAEKARQVELTERLTNLTAQNADQKIVQSVAAELQTTEKTIERLQLHADNAAEALALRKVEREEEFEEKKWTPEKQRLWYIDAIEREKKKLEDGTDEQKTKAEGNIAKWEQKLANIEKVIEANKPEAEKPRTVLDMITHAIRDGLAGVTAGGNVDLDASLYNIATETTLQEILRLLGGNGAVEYANQLKAELAKDRPRYERKKYDGGNASGGSAGGKKTRVNKDLDKLNADGQRIYGELEAEAKVFTGKLKENGKRYTTDFDFAKAIKAQADVVKKQTKGSLEYIQEQTKLTALYQDYYHKTFGKGRKKKGQPGQSAWATKDEELKKIKGLKDLLLFKSNRADALVGLNYGVEGAAQVDEVVTESKPKKTNKKKNTKKSTKVAEATNIADGDNLQQVITDAIKAAKTDDTQSDDDTVMSKILGIVMQTMGLDPNDEDVAKIISNVVGDDAFSRDVDDDILSSKDQLAQVLYTAIIEAYKMVASGGGIFAETSYRLDELGNVLDVQRGTMIESSASSIGSVWGHTHPEDELFGSVDFSAAAKNAGLFDVFELITPLNKYVISGLKEIDADALKTIFNELASVATTAKNDKLSRSEYNDKIKSAIVEKGLKLEIMPTGLEQSDNFKKIRSASFLQSAVNHDLSLDAFEPMFKRFIAELQEKNYQFEQDSPLGKLVDAINKTVQTTYSSADDKEDAFEELRPLLENVFGKNPDARIPATDRQWYQKLVAHSPYLGYEIDDAGQEKAMKQWKELFSDGKTLRGEKGGYRQFSEFGRDVDVKTEVKDGIKEGVAENSKTTASDKRLPYAVDPNSLIGKLQNTVGGNTGELAKQGTLAQILSELQAISNKIPTIGKSGVKSSAQNLLEEFQKMAAGSAMDGKERVAYFDLVNGAMSPSLSGTTHSISQKLLNDLSQQFGIDKGYRSQIHTHADSNQTWFSKKDLNYMEKNIGDFGADSIKQQILLTKDTITVFDMTMVETAENAKKAIDILKGAGENIDNNVLEQLANLGVRYQTKNLDIGAKGLMDLLGVKNFKNDGKKKGAIANPEVAQKGLEDYAQADADARNSKYVFNSFDGETLKYQLVDVEGHISKVVLAWDELEGKVRVVSDTSTSSMDATVQKIQQYRAEIKKAQNEKLLSDGDDANFVAAEEEVNNILQQIEAGDLSGQKLSEAINTLDAARAKLADEGAKLHKLIAKNNKLRGGTAEVKSAVTQGVKVRSLLGDTIETNEQDGMQLFSVADDAPASLQTYIRAYNDLVKIQQQYINDGQINSPKIQDALKVQAASVKKLGAEVMTAYQNTLRLQEQSDVWQSQTYTDKAGKEHALGGSKYVGNQGVDRVAMLQYAKEVLGADLASVKLNTTTGKLTGVLRKNNYVVADMAVEYDKTTGKMHLFQEKERESLGGLPGFMNALKEKSKAITQYIMSMTSIYRVFGELKRGIQYIREIDSALTELKKVTNETEETYDRFLNTAAKTADKVGSTIKEIVSSTADWARLGFSMEEAARLAESTAVLLNVSEFQSIDDATSALTSTLQAFGYVAKDSMHVVDVLNEVGNNFAISSDGIATALQDSASSLMAANNSYEQAVALIASANRVVQDPNSVGAALRTISLRLRGTSTKELEEAGEDTTGVVESKSKLRTKIQGYTGIDILTDSGAYKSTYEILLQISKVWDDLTDQDRAGLLELIAGKTRSNTAAAILSNTKDLEAAFKSAQEAEGSALRENEKYLNSIQGRIDLFNNAVQTMWNNALDSEVVKGFVNLGTILVELIDKFGLIKTLVVGIGTYLIQKHWKGDLFGGLFGDKTQGISQMKKSLETLKKARDDAEEALTKSPNSKRKQRKFTKAQSTYETYEQSVSPKIKEYDDLLAKRTLAQEKLNKANHEFIKATREGADSTTLEAYGNNVKNAKAELDAVNLKLKEVEIQAGSAGNAGMTFGQKFVTGAKTAGQAIMKFGKQLATSLLTMYAITTVIELLTKGAGWLVNKIKGAGESAEEAQEKFEELNNELSNAESELRSLETELDDTQSKINELMSMGTLSFADQEELNRLRAQSKELEYQIELKKQLQENLQKGTNAASVNATDKYLDTSFSSEETKSEKQERWGDNGKTIGQTMGLIGSAIALSVLAATGVFTGGATTALAIAGASALIGGAAGEMIGTGAGGVSYDKDQTVKEAIDNMATERANLEKTRDEAYKAYTDSPEDNKLKEKYEDAEAELSQYDEAMAKHISQIQANYNAMDWETATDSQREEMEEMADLLDKYNIVMGSTNAKTNAITRIFGKDEYAGVSEAIDSLVEKYKETGDDTILSQIRAEASKATKDLKDVGLSIQDVVDYYTLEKGLFDSSTVKGIALQYAKGVEILQKFADAAANSRKELGEKALGDDGIERMKELQQGGAVDLFNRPRIDAEVLKDNGWTDAGDGIATVFTSTYSNADNTVAMNFTPILPNGQVLSPDELTQYAEEVIAGIREDDLNLKVGATFEGENAIQEAEAVADEVHQLQEKYYKDPVKGTIEFEVDGKTKKVKWDDLFEEGKDGEFEAKEEKFSDMLKGMNEEAQTTFISLAEKVKNGQLSWNQAMDAFNAKGLVASLEVANEQISAVNTEMFADVKDDLSGLIDTFGELSSVLESTATSMDLLHTAQTQMNNSGQISVKTALELMQSTDKWNEILVIEEGNLKLANNAEQVLIQSKLDHIKVNLENALATVKAQIAAVEANSSSYDFATTLDESTNIAVQEMSKSMITLVALMEAYASNGRISVSSAMASADEQIAALDNRLNAYKGPKKTKQETLSGLYKQQEQLEAMLGMYGRIDTTSEFKNNYDFDKTPGDKYDDDKDGDSALEALQKRYERKIKDLEAQQTQIENEIEILEAKEEGVSASYYEKQIDLEEEKIALYQQERAELLKLNRTDEVADAIWEVEHAIQESTLSLIEFRKSIMELYETASERISDAYDSKGQLFDDRKSFIENEISIRETKGELIPTSVYDDLIAQEKQAHANAEAELNAQADLYWQGINSGQLTEDSEEALAILEKIRQKKLETQEHDKAIAEYAEQQKDAYIAYFDKMMEAYSHRNDFFQSQSDYAQSYIDRLGVLNINVPDEAYEKMAEIQKLSNDGLKEQLAFASNELNNLEANGIDKNDSRYIEKFNEVLDLEKQVYEGETKVLEYHQQIIDNHIDRFNQVVDRINHSISQLENVSGLISNEDVATEDGVWTSEGLTQAGMLYHQMEYNKQVAAEYAEEMKYLKEQYDRGKISEKEYTEQMQELTDGQWDAINAYKSAEDAIIDLNEARIDMIEEGLDKEIEAYQELIDLKKEELDAERDLYDFRKDIQKQTKDIAALERRIASMSGSTDASTIAERSKLEAELREAREGLDDTYYGHAMDSQSNALDDELEAYEKSTEDYLKSLRESIKDTKLLIENTCIDVLANADIVMSKITELSGTYKFTLDPNLTEPWINASSQATLFKQNTDLEVGSLIGEGGIITVFGSEDTKTKLSGVFGAGSSAASQFALDVGKHMTSTETTVNSYTSPEQAKYLGTKLKKPWEDAEAAPLHWSQVIQDYMTNGVVGYAEKYYETQLRENLDYPWNQANGYTSWGQGVQTMLDAKVEAARQAGIKIAEHLNVQTKNYAGNGSDSGSDDIAKTGGYVAEPAGDTPVDEDVKTLQAFLNEGFGAGLTKDGKYGPATQKAVENAQRTVYAYLESIGYRNSLTSFDGKYGKNTRSWFITYWNEKSYRDRQNREWWDRWKPKLPAAMYAKGTMGTDRDQWAIDSEPWLGDELVLVPTASGNLSYMRKGTGVLTADLTRELMDIASIGVDGLTMPKFDSGINIISNAISKPELNISFDSMVHVDNCSQDTLKDLEKMVDTKINQFNRQLNQSLRKFK